MTQCHCIDQHYKLYRLEQKLLFYPYLNKQAMVQTIFDLSIQELELGVSVSVQQSYLNYLFFKLQTSASTIKLYYLESHGGLNWEAQPPLSTHERECIVHQAQTRQFQFCCYYYCIDCKPNAVSCVWRASARGSSKSTIHVSLNRLSLDCPPTPGNVLMFTTQ